MLACTCLYTQEILTKTTQNVGVKVQQPVDVCGSGVYGATVVFPNTIPGVVVVTVNWHSPSFSQVHIANALTLCSCST